MAYINGQYVGDYSSNIDVLQDALTRYQGFIDLNIAKIQDPNAYPLDPALRQDWYNEKVRVIGVYQAEMARIQEKIGLYQTATQEAVGTTVSDGVSSLGGFLPILLIGGAILAWGLLK